MRQKKFWFTMSGILAVLTMALMLPTNAGAASNYKMLHRFTGGDDGAYPYGGLIFDAAGRNLYGTTLSGGAHAGGTVFKLTPNSDGSWTVSVLYAFCSVTNCADGGNPYAGLIFDAGGSLYGTTYGGGATGVGTVFKLTPNSDGSWTERVLYSFTGADGAYPHAGLIFDAAGNLYGTTLNGGNPACNNPYGCGVVFKLTPNPHGSWTESVLINFTRGLGSFGELIFDVGGNLYGAAYDDANPKCDVVCGTVFELTPNPDGRWEHSILHSFTGGKDGDHSASLIFDRSGNLYSTTNGGGAFGKGVVFKLTPNSDEVWTERVLHAFAGRRAAFPLAGLIFDAAGNLYGTATSGGPLNEGAVFELTPQSDGSWAYSVLHVFQGTPAWQPSDRLVLDHAGNLYGTTPVCARHREICRGVVFEITP